MQGCSQDNIVQRGDTSVIVRYYLTVEPANSWIGLNHTYLFSNQVSKEEGEALIRQDTENPLRSPNEAIHKVYFSNDKTYQQHIPLKDEVYYGQLEPRGMWLFDDSGRVTKYISNGIEMKTFQYGQDIKIIIGTLGNHKYLQKYFYKNGQFIQMLEFDDTGILKSSVRYNRKKNILEEFDIRGKVVDIYHID